jgi:hypothetical protein
MNPRIIVIDGKTYKGVDEMPPDVRQQYEQAMRSFMDQNANHIPDLFEDNSQLADRNKDGIPDIMENTPGGKIVATAMKILVDGREFNSLDDLPPDARTNYEKAMRALDANRNGIPDVLEGTAGRQQNLTSVSTSVGAEIARPVSRPEMRIESPTMTPDTSNGWMLVLLGAVILFLCAAGAVGVWYFFLR